MSTTMRIHNISTYRFPFNSPSRAQAYNNSINSRMLYHCMIWNWKVQKSEHIFLFWQSLRQIKLYHIAHDGIKENLPHLFITDQVLVKQFCIFFWKAEQRIHLYIHAFHCTVVYIFLLIHRIYIYYSLQRYKRQNMSLQITTFTLFIRCKLTNKESIKRMVQLWTKWY